MKVFKIKQQIKLMTFELKLSKYSKTHLIIHAALLESASENAKLAKIINVEEYKNQNYIIKKILKKIKSIKQIIILSNKKIIMIMKIFENLLNILKKLNKY